LETDAEIQNKLHTTLSLLIVDSLEFLPPRGEFLDFAFIGSGGGKFAGTSLSIFAINVNLSSPGYEMRTAGTVTPSPLEMANLRTN
jgi:hypothetical protein